MWRCFGTGMNRRAAGRAGRYSARDPMELLLIEDEPRLAGLLVRRLGREGHRTTVATTGPEGLRLAAAGGWDLAIVDVMLPGLSGMEVTRALRRAGSDVPLLMLTARGAVEDRVEGLRAGADDYLVKPFAFAELSARIEALARRSGSGPRLSFGPVRVDPQAHLATVDGRELDLTPKEFAVLKDLLWAGGRVVTRAELKRSVWGFQFDAPTKVVDLYVHYLRRKLRRAGAADLIETVRGVGYAIGRSGPPDRSAPPDPGVTPP